MEDKIRLIDVGARRGIDPRWNPYFKNLEVLAFEPDPEECSTLNSKEHPYTIRYLPIALGADNNKEATLFITRQPGCSSLLQPNAELCRDYQYGQAMEVVDKKSITLNRLENICDGFQPDVIKVDTQGTELDVLIGAGKLLDNVLVVELEIEFVPQYMGQAVFSDVDAYMRQRGFSLRGIRRTYWRAKAEDYTHCFGGQLFHGDALYIRPDQINCTKGHIILAAYRQYDLLTHFGITHLIPEQPMIIRLISQLLSGYSNRELRRLVDRIRPAHATDWHDPDFF
jgi:FkbM family methyltransferase